MAEKPYLPEPVEFTPEILEQIHKETEEIIKSYKHVKLGSPWADYDVRSLQRVVAKLLERIEKLEAEVNGLSKNAQRTI